jgi:parvulin-like peptidyl-prolyl isomerase
MLRRALLLLALLPACQQAEIIDRIVVSVGNLVVTASEVRREIKMAAFLNGAEPDFGADSRHKATERLIEQKLIRKEMEVGRYPGPSAAETEPLLQQVREQRFKSNEEYLQALQKYGISEPDLKAQLLWQLTVLRFIDFRFRVPGETTSQPQANQEIDKQMDVWLKEARARTRVEYRPEPTP